VTVYRKDNPVPKVIIFPTNLVSNLEVKDAKGLQEFLANYLRIEALPNDSGILLLSEEVYFAKEFPIVEGKDQTEEIRAFLGIIPIGISNLVSKEIVLNGKKFVYASNRSLGVNVVYGFAAGGLKTTEVLPAFVVGINDQTVFGVETIASITANLPKEKSYSMLPNIFANEKKRWWHLW